MELVTSKDSLMILLNEALDKDKNRVLVYSGEFGLDLFYIDIENSKLISVCQQDHFQKVMEPFQSKVRDQRLAREIPDISDFRATFQNSLLTPPINMNDCVDLLKSIVEKKTAKMNYSRQWCLAIDTNIAYRRILTRIFNEKETYGLEEADFSKIQVLIPQLVKKEITYWIQDKYDDRFMNSMSSFFNNGKNPFRSMKNCTFLQGRKAQNAQTEIALIRNYYPVLDVAGGEWNVNKEERDIEMLKALENFHKANNMDVTYLTADDKAAAHLEAYSMQGLVLKYPREVPSTLQADPWSLIELLYETSLVMGPISLKGLGVRIASDWSGKSHEQYKSEMMKWYIDETSPMSEQLVKDLKIIEEMRNVSHFSAI